MTVPDARVSENPNRVRCFRKDALMPDVLDEKWELIKVTCTQAFNKHVKYGLSFIKVHTPDASPTPSSPLPVSSALQTTVASPKEKKSCDESLGLPKNNVFAQFKIRGDSSDSDKETDSSLFSKWKQEKESPKKASSDHNISCKLFKPCKLLSDIQMFIFLAFKITVMNLSTICGWNQSKRFSDNR